jgi:hypothetical protein
MKSLFKNFVNEFHSEEQEIKLNSDSSLETVKIPTVTLFERVGEAFNQEYKEFITTRSAP